MEPPNTVCPKTLEIARQNNDHRLLTKSGFKDDFFGAFSANVEGCFLTEMDHNNLLYQLMAIQMVSHWFLEERVSGYRGGRVNSLHELTPTLSEFPKNTN